MEQTSSSSSSSLLLNVHAASFVPQQPQQQRRRRRRNKNDIILHPPPTNNSSIMMAEESNSLRLCDRSRRRRNKSITTTTTTVIASSSSSSLAAGADGAAVVAGDGYGDGDDDDESLFEQGGGGGERNHNNMKKKHSNDGKRNHAAAMRHRRRTRRIHNHNNHNNSVHRRQHNNHDNKKKKKNDIQHHHHPRPSFEQQKKKKNHRNKEEEISISNMIGNHHHQTRKNNGLDHHDQYSKRAERQRRRGTGHGSPSSKNCEQQQQQINHDDNPTRTEEEFPSLLLLTWRNSHHNNNNNNNNERISGDGGFIIVSEEEEEEEEGSDSKTFRTNHPPPTPSSSATPARTTTTTSSSWSQIALQGHELDVQRQYQQQQQQQEEAQQELQKRTKKDEKGETGLVVLERLTSTTTTTTSGSSSSRAVSSKEDRRRRSEFIAVCGPWDDDDEDEDDDGEHQQSDPVILSATDPSAASPTTTTTTTTKHPKQQQQQRRRLLHLSKLRDRWWEKLYEKRAKDIQRDLEDAKRTAAELLLALEKDEKQKQQQKHQRGVQQETKQSTVSVNGRHLHGGNNNNNERSVHKIDESEEDDDDNDDDDSSQTSALYESEDEYPLHQAVMHDDVDGLSRLLEKGGLVSRSFSGQKSTRVTTTPLDAGQYDYLSPTPTPSSTTTTTTTPFGTQTRGDEQQQQRHHGLFSSLDPIELAIYLQKSHLLKILLHYQLPRNAFDALALAIQRDSASCLQVLFHHGLSVASKSSTSSTSSSLHNRHDGSSISRTLFHVAAECGCGKPVWQVLIRQAGKSGGGGSNHHKDYSSSTLVKLLSASASVAVTETSTASTPPPQNDKDTFVTTTALHLCCSRGQVELVETTLYESNLSINMCRKLLRIKDSQGRTPLLTAIAFQQPEVVLTILMWRRSYDQPDAAATGASSTSSLVIDPYVYSVNQKESMVHMNKDPIRECPLVFAVQNKSMDIMLLLLEFSDAMEYQWNAALQAAVVSNTNDAECCEEDRQQQVETVVEMVQLLLEAGADPLATSNRKNYKRSSTTTALVGATTSFTLAATQASDYRILQALLDCYTKMMRTKQAGRRRDPHLWQRRPDSYFDELEKRENAATHSALEEALIRALLLGWSHNHNMYYGPPPPQQRTVRLQCAILLYKSGATLSSASVERLRQSMKQHRLHPFLGKEGSQALPMIVLDHAEEPAHVCQGEYRHFTPDKGVRLNVYSRSCLDFWSRAMMQQQSWIKDKSIFTNRKESQCRWIRNYNDNQATKQQQQQQQHECLSDQAVLVCMTGEEFLIHAALVSSKSEKLSAALRFAMMMHSMKNPDDELDGGSESRIRQQPPRIDVGLSSRQCEWMLQHMYHGSMVLADFGNENPCDILLDMAMVAQEFLCPSLMQECEMRLLSSSPTRCMCWSCCPRVVDTGTTPFSTSSTKSALNSKQSGNEDGAEGRCFVSCVVESQWITAASALNVLAVCEQLQQTLQDYDDEPTLSGGSFYELTVRTKRGFMDRQQQFRPFEFTKLVAIRIMLCNFAGVMDSFAFEQSQEQDPHCEEIIVHEEECGQSGASTTSSNSIALLNMCLDELAYSMQVEQSTNHRLPRDDEAKEGSCSSPQTKGTSAHGSSHYDLPLSAI